MDNYTDMSHHEEYEKWRAVQDQNSNILSYEEWLRVFIYKLNK